MIVDAFNLSVSNGLFSKTPPRSSHRKRAKIGQAAISNRMKPTLTTLTTIKIIMAIEYMSMTAIFITTVINATFQEL